MRGEERRRLPGAHGRFRDISRLKPGGDHCHPEFVSHRGLDDGAKNDIGVIVRRLPHDRHGVVDFVQRDIEAAGQVHQGRCARRGSTTLPAAG